MLATGKKKRVLPEWMLSPGKEVRSAKKSCDKLKSIKDFFSPQEKEVKKTLDFDVFDFGDGSENKTREKIDDKYSDKPTVFIMSPAELEEVARLVLEQN